MNPLTIRPKFNFGTKVYLATGEWEGTVTGITVRPGGSLQYLVTWDTMDEHPHYDVELSEDKPLNL